MMKKKQKAKKNIVKVLFAIAVILSIFKPNIMNFIVVTILAKAMLDLDFIECIYFFLPLSMFFERIEFNIGLTSIKVRMITYLIILVVLGYYLLIKKVKFENTSINTIFIFYILTMLVSTLFSKGSLIVAIPKLSRTVICFIIFNIYFSTKINKQKFCETIIAASFIPVFLGLKQAITKDTLFLNGAFRVNGTYDNHPVAFSLYLTIIIFLIIFIYNQCNKKVDRFFLSIYLMITIIVMFNTYTRLIIVMVAAFFMFTLIRKRKYKSIIIIVIMVMIYIFYNAEILNRFAILLMDSSNDNSMEFRKYIYSVIIPLVNKNPIIGWGTGIGYIIFQQFTGIANVAIHNEYLEIIFEQGIIGLVFYVSLQLVVLYKLIKSKNDISMVTLTIFLIINVFSFIHNPNYFYDIEMIIWALVGLGAKNIES